LLILLFTAIFSTISVIEDRRAGFLQGVLVAPVGRGAILAAKVLGGTTLAVGQAALVLLFAPLIGIPLTPGAFALAVAAMILVAVALTAMGFCIAWLLDSTQGFHAIMNVFLIPLWLLSGAVFPPSGSAGWLATLVHFNPLSYGLALIRRAIYLAGDPGSLPPLPLSLLVTVVYAAGMLAIGAWLVHRNRTSA
jgi:ABC-2 type transport system permease protein